MKRQFPLTSEEDDLFSALKSVVAEYNLHTTVRVAGGWVRDKVLYSGNILVHFISLDRIYLTISNCSPNLLSAHTPVMLCYGPVYN